MKKDLLCGLSASAFVLSALLSACSEPTPSGDGQMVARELPVVPVQTSATAGPGVVIDGPDATLDLAAFNAACADALSYSRKQFETLKASTETPTVGSVLRPYDNMNMGPSDFGTWAYFMSSVHPDADMRAAGNDCVQQFVELGTDVSLSREIFDLLMQVDASEADRETQYYLAETIKDYKSSGVNKDEETRSTIRDLIKGSFAIGQEFGKNIREDVRYVEIDDVTRLDGLPQDYIDNHPADENGIILLSTNYPDYFPVMAYAHDDALRQEMRMAYGGRAYPANESVLRSLLKSRHALAQVLDFDNYAETVTADRMIGSATAAGDFIDGISAVARPPAELEKARLLKRYREIDPEADQVMPWQRSYVMDIIRREQYDLDAKEVREYFQYDNVRQGIFQLIEDLFDLEFKPWETSVWDESVEAFEVYENGALIGRFYLDMHPRDGKYKHAAHMGLRKGVLGKQIPLSALMCNFPGGDGTAGLMEHGEVETFLHEFGHLIHNMLSGTQAWSGISGMAMERDFVEAPSQMLEEWIWDYDTLKAFARNMDGEVLPRPLFNKMKAARDFGLTTGTAGQTFLAAVSLNFYNQNPDDIDFLELQKELYAKYSVYDYVGGTYLFANFGHLNGYSAIYYTYQWSLAIASDMFTEFEKAGLRNKDVASRYRHAVLGAAGSRPAGEFVGDFLGRPWSLEAYRSRLETAVAVEETAEGG